MARFFSGLKHVAKKLLYIMLNDREIRRFIDSLNIERNTYPPLDSELIHRRKLVLYKVNGKIVGLGGLTRNNTLFIVVKKEFWGRGIGTKIMRELLKDEANVVLSVYTQNKRAVRLYEKFGFKPYSILMKWSRGV